MQSDLLTEIEDFLVGRPIAETTFGRLAVNDGKFVPRLRTGANVTVHTIDRARSFMREVRAGEAHAGAHSPEAA